MQIPYRLLPGVAWAMLTGRKRSFRADARLAMCGYDRGLLVLGEEHIPQGGPCLITANHYWHPDFDAWWLVLAISSLVPQEIHWVATSAWRSPGLLGALSRWLFPRGSAVWGFTAMPPIPPDPWEVEARAQAVRKVLGYARASAAPLIGLAPEGRDVTGGSLGEPPSGAGRFILLLSQYCSKITPVGVYYGSGEDGQKPPLTLHFGSPYVLEPPGRQVVGRHAGRPLHTSAEERDRRVSEQVMRRIAALLPEALRGPYA